MAHRAVPGTHDTNAREGKRIPIFGDAPYFDPKESLSLSEWNAKQPVIAGKVQPGTSGYVTKFINDGDLNVKDADHIPYAWI